jgi:hypothetical protein
MVYPFSQPRLCCIAVIPVKTFGYQQSARGGICHKLAAASGLNVRHDPIGYGGGPPDRRALAQDRERPLKEF